MAKIKSSVNDEPANSFTSMIDIVFLLLIFFILQPFKAPEMMMNSDLPKDSGPSESISTPRQNINLIIRSDVTDPKKEGAIYFVDGQMVGKSRLGAHAKLPDTLLRKSGGAKDTPVSIQAEPGIRFENVLAALDACYQAEMPDVKWSPPDPAYKPKYMR